MKPILPTLLGSVSALLIVFLAPARADRIHLKDGRVLEGEVTEEKDGRIRLKMKLGSVWLRKDRILRVEKVLPPREAYEKRRKVLLPGDAPGWMKLGRFCLEKGLEREAEACFRAALKAAPDLAEAVERLDAIHAGWTARTLLEADDSDERMRLVAGLVGLGDAGKKAVVEAILERDGRIFRLVKKPDAVQARIADEVDRLRKRLRNTVGNANLYTDSAEETKARVEAWVATLRHMLEDPAGPDNLRLHPPLGKWLEERDRLLKALAGFYPDPKKSRPPPKSRVVEMLQKAVRRMPFLRVRHPFAEANAEVKILNEKDADAGRLAKIEFEGVRAVNDYRDLVGLNRLRFDAALHRAASGHSRAMAEKGFFSHRSPLPGLATPYARMRKAGYDFRIAGENVARKEDGLSAREALDAWIASPGHHRNLLVAEFEDVGLGVHGTFWTLNLGTKRKKKE
jgi:uncharacterized protein YkwD